MAQPSPRLRLEPSENGEAGKKWIAFKTLGGIFYCKANEEFIFLNLEIKMLLRRSLNCLFSPEIV